MPVGSCAASTARLGLAAVALACGIEKVGAQGAPSIRLLPHKATYSLTLDRSRPAGNIAAIDGKTDYSLEQTSCSWLRSLTAITLNFRGTNGARVNVASTVEVQERAGGAEMQFKTRRLQDGVQVQASEGTARRESGRVIIRTTAPEPRTLEVGDDVQFPIQQLASVLEAAGNGRTQAGGRLYDGSETGVKLLRMTAQIGVPTRRRVQSAGEHPAWPVTASYFGDAAANPALPEYGLGATLLQNGIYADLRLTFTDYALTGTLTDLIVLPPGNCD